MATVFDKTFEHREALFFAAIDEFAAKGFENASINAILAEAGMSKGQFYYHFGSKEELYLALIAAVINRKRKFMASRVVLQDMHTEIFELFSHQLAYGLEFSQLYPEINRFADSFIREKGNPIYDKALEQYNLGSADFLEQIVERAYESGQLRRDLPLSFIKHAIGFIFTHAIEIAALTTVDSAAENLEHLIAFLRSGFGSQNP